MNSFYFRLFLEPTKEGRTDLLYFCFRKFHLLITTDMHTVGAELSGFIGVLIVQVTILIIYAIFVRYDNEMLPTDAKNDNFTAKELTAIEEQHRVSYPRKSILQ